MSGCVKPYVFNGLLANVCVVNDLSCSSVVRLSMMMLFIVWSTISSDANISV